MLAGWCFVVCVCGGRVMIDVLDVEGRRWREKCVIKK